MEILKFMDDPYFKAVGTAGLVGGVMLMLGICNYNVTVAGAQKDFADKIGPKFQDHALLSAGETYRSRVIVNPTGRDWKERAEMAQTGGFYNIRDASFPSRRLGQVPTGHGINDVIVTQNDMGVFRCGEVAYYIAQPAPQFCALLNASSVLIDEQPSENKPVQITASESNQEKPGKPVLSDQK